MTISRIELQGQVARAQDFTTIKQNEDNKAAVDQTHFQQRFDQSVDERHRQVQQGERSENMEKRFDAREEGNGAYAGDGGRKRKKEEEKESNGKVLIKGRGSFDIKI